MKKLSISLIALVSSTMILSADGAAIYAKCAGCHGKNGEKPALGKSELIRGWEVDKIEKTLKDYKAGTRNIHGMGSLMKGQVSSLSDADIKAVAEYIHKLE